MAAPEQALIVADGDVDMTLLSELAGAAHPKPLLIAADGGAARVLEAGLRPDVVVGDFDSLADADRTRLEELGVELCVADPDKDESDMELCLLAALDAGAARITILGALGVVRPEHSVANLLLLADPRLDGRDVAIAGRGSCIWRIGSPDGPGEAIIEGEPGDFVSLFPLGAASEGVTSTGLRFGLHDETLPLGPSRGLSNALLETRAAVATRRGCLLVIHTQGSMSDAPPTGGT
jgi:thiamine pyrophosphokinase